MESLGVGLFEDIYQSRRVLITGQTGFKGSWLALWLSQLGAHVSAIALEPDTVPNHWNLLQLKVNDHCQDVRDYQGVAGIVAAEQPEIVFHLAAQPLVRSSYDDPLTTWSTNVMGTANLLEACRAVKSVRAIVVVTTDKCYDNLEIQRGYQENDRLGGHDPYSASKAATELLVASYRKSFMTAPGTPLLASARAGNVIGGGDWSEDRLIPDLVRAISAGCPLEIRLPHATRPWQHILESLSGYLLLGQKLLQGDAYFAQAWNFGPELEGNKSVVQVLNMMKAYWPQVCWSVGNQAPLYEATLLYLDSSKARKELGWKPVWPLESALKATCDWYQTYAETGKAITGLQLQRYIEAARALRVTWSLR